jgi:DNA polymerase elongation subunit (family B)
VNFNRKRNQIDYTYYEKEGSKWERKAATHYIENEVYVPNQSAVIQYRNAKLKDTGIGFKCDVYGNPILEPVNTKFYDQKTLPPNVKNCPKRFGFDIKPEVKFLSEKFDFDEDKDEVPPLRIQYMDIETIVDDGPFLEGWSVGPDRYGYDRGGILLISSYDNVDDKVTVFGAQPISDHKFQKGLNVEYVLCNDEADIIKQYMRYLIETDPDAISGWNCYQYDFPYIINRIHYYIETGRFNKSALYNFGHGSVFIQNHKRKFYLNGITIIDYLVLYKKFELKPRRSYKLADIVEAEDVAIDGEGKIKYSGSIRDFYKKDWTGFVKYCVQDSMLVKNIDDKKKLIDTFVMLCYMAGVPLHLAISDEVSWMKIHDSSIYRYCRERDKELPENEEPPHNLGKFAGAYVMAPKVGVYEYVTVFDVASLYPSCIRALNISTDSYRGQIVMNKDDFSMGSVIDQKGPFTIHFYDPLWLSLSEYERKLVERENSKLPPDKRKDPKSIGPFEKKFQTFEELSTFLKKFDMCIGANGSIFTKKFRGVIPALLDEWIDIRKKNKNLYFEYKGKYQAEKDKKKKKKYKLMSDRYNTIQKIYKIRLNSLYGFIGAKFSRFFNVHMSEAVTKTGKYVIRSTIEKLRNKYNDDFVFYCDTDSVFLDYGQVLKRRGFDLSDKKACVEECLKMDKEIADEIKRNCNFVAQEIMNTDNMYSFESEEVIERMIEEVSCSYCL